MLDIKEKRHITVVGRGGASNIEWDDIQDKPEFATVATSGSYNDLSDKPEIPGQVNADWDANSGVAQILNKPNLATVATSGSYNDLSNKPDMSHYVEDTDLASVATSGSYNDLTDKPTIPPQQWFGTQQEYDAIQVKDPDVVYNIEGGQAQADWTENDSSDPSYIQNKPTLATVATSGSYSDLSNTPSLATVATSGSYNDLTDKPTIPSAQVNSDWDANSGVAQILNKPNLATVATSGSYADLSNTPSLATVATSGSYNDLTDKPTIPSAQVNSDWNASSGVQQILNKPTLATVATSGSYNDLSNTPSLATVATSGSYNDLSNTPSLATVATSGSYSDLSNTPSLATVATSGSYNDLSNKPTIPTVPAMTTQELTFTLQGGTTKTIEFYTVPNYFYVEDISGSNNTLSITKSSASAPDVEVFYSTDKVNWTNMGTTSTTAITATIPANGKLYLKANTNSWAFNIITASGNHNVGGNIMSLLYSDNFTNQTSIQSNGTFRALFKNNNKIVNSNNLELPATTMTNSSYNEMFSNCRALVTAPALPATTLANACYSHMFEYCTSLTTAPELPATTLANACYQAMFRYCSALTTAPELPATTLANLCYNEMFYFCGSLTTAPELPATTPYQSCYESMFQNCSSLTTAPVIKLNTLNISCMGYMFSACSKLNNVISYITQLNSNYMNNWLQYVSATGDFYNLGGATYPSGASGIPSGWTEHTSL